MKNNKKQKTIQQSEEFWTNFNIKQKEKQQNIPIKKKQENNSEVRDCLPTETLCSKTNHIGVVVEVFDTILTPMTQITRNTGNVLECFFQYPAEISSSKL